MNKITYLDNIKKNKFSFRTIILNSLKQRFSTRLEQQTNKINRKIQKKNGMHRFRGRNS